MTLRYWIFVLGALGLTTLISVNTYAAARLLRHWRPERNLLLMPGETLVRLGLIGICIVLGLFSGLTLEELGWLAPSPIRQVVVGLCWGAVLALFFYLSTKWLIHYTGGRFYSPVIVQAVVPRSGSELFWVSLTMISVVLLEELLFRSLLLGGLAQVAPAPLLAIGWSIVFGLLHSPQGRWGMTGAALGGLLLSWLFLGEASLLAPLVAHYVANELQLILAMRLHPTSSS